MSTRVAQLETALRNWSVTLRSLRRELEAHPDVADRAALAALWDDVLLPKADRWLTQTAEARNDEAALRSGGFSHALQQMMGLGRDLDTDLSWSRFGPVFRQTIENVVTAASYAYRDLESM
jgi:hypothetical protein